MMNRPWTETAGYTIAAVAASLAITATIRWALGAPVWSGTLAIAFLCPALIAPSLIAWDFRRQERVRGLMAELEAAHAALRSAYDRLAEQASRDELTGLFNRAAFFAYAERHGGTAGVLLLLDVDRFKAINDSHGHVVGDAALRAVAEAIGQAAGSGGLAARVGGEEFAVHLPDLAPDAAASIAERIRDSVRRLRVPAAAEEVVPLSVSIGGAAGRPGASFMDLYQEADRQLYRAKHEGRNQVQGFTESEERGAREDVADLAGGAELASKA